MHPLDPTALLRPGLLDGITVAVAGSPSAEPFAAAAAGACRALGASVWECRLPAGLGDGAEAAIADEVALRCSADGTPDLLAVDAAGLFASTPGDGGGGRGSLGACLELTWNTTKAVVEHGFLPAGRGGRIVYLAPRPDAGEHAEAARAGLENLGRTLSIEWARHAINALAIAPGEGERPAAAEVGALVAYLASPAGAYFSGCLLDLRGP